MFLHRIEDSDRLMNLVLGRLSKDWIGLTGFLDKKNGSFLWILDRTRRWFVFGFPKKEEVDWYWIFSFGFSWIWISNLLDGLVFFGYWMICSINQLLTQKYVQHVMCTIADLLFFNFMVITLKQVNYPKNKVVSTTCWLGVLRLHISVITLGIIGIYVMDGP